MSHKVVKNYVNSVLDVSYDITNIAFVEVTSTSKDKGRVFHVVPIFKDPATGLCENVLTQKPMSQKFRFEPQAKNVVFECNKTTANGEEKVKYSQTTLLEFYQKVKNKSTKNRDNIYIPEKFKEMALALQKNESFTVSKTALCEIAKTTEQILTEKTSILFKASKALSFGR